MIDILLYISIAIGMGLLFFNFYIECKEKENTKLKNIKIGINILNTLFFIIVFSISFLKEFELYSILIPIFLLAYVITFISISFSMKAQEKFNLYSAIKILNMFIVIFALTFILLVALNKDFFATYYAPVFYATNSPLETELIGFSYISSVIINTVLFNCFYTIKNKFKKG